MTAQRRWGYLVWVVAGAVIFIPELLAAAGAGWLPFTTISTMTGHLERHHRHVQPQHHRAASTHHDVGDAHHVAELAEEAVDAAP